PIVAAFLHVYRDVEVDLRLTGRFLNLARAGVDIGVWVGALPDASQPAVQFGVLPLILLASPEYLEQRGRPAHPRELVDHDCVTFTGVRVDYSKDWAVSIDGEPARVPVNGRMRITTAESAVQAAIAGAGI